MASPITNTRGTIQTLLTTELNSLANNTNAISGSAITFTNAGHLQAEIELVVTFGTAPTANTCLTLWLLREVDGTNYEDGGSSVTPGRAPDAFFPLRAVTTAQRIIMPITNMPPGTAYVLVRNDGTGQTTAASANTVKIRTFTQQF